MPTPAPTSAGASSATPAIRDDVQDVLGRMPGKERRALVRRPLAESLQHMSDILSETEHVLSLTCATSSALGRGVLALTDRRLVFCCTRSGERSWSLEELRSIEGRPANFTLPPAVHLEVPEGRRTFALGAGHRWGPRFVEAVQQAAVPTLAA